MNEHSKIRKPKEAAAPVKGELKAPELADPNRDLVKIKNPKTGDVQKVKSMYVDLWIKKYGYEVVKEKE